MIYNYFILGLFFVMTFVLGMGTGASMALIQIAHGQSNTTVSVPVPITVPTLQYQPTVPEAQQEPPSNNQGITEIITSIVVIAVGAFAGKIHSDRKSSSQNKENMAAILQNKEIQKEIARVMYSLNQEKANAINDAPTVKLENLENDVKQYADKAAKS